MIYQTLLSKCSYFGLSFQNFKFAYITYLLSIQFWFSCLHRLLLTFSLKFSNKLSLNLPSRCSRSVPFPTYSTTMIRSSPCSRYPYNLTKFRCSIIDSVSISFLNSKDNTLSYVFCHRVSTQIIQTNTRNDPYLCFYEKLS